MNNEFTKEDMFWSIDLFMEAGKVIDVDESGYGIMHNNNLDRKRRSTGKTKEECINSMIEQLEKLRDYPCDY